MMPDNDDHALIILAKRTRENLEYIDEKKSQGEPVNEFTQLLNSTFCMVICLSEEYIKKPDLSQKDVQRLESLQEQTSPGSIAGNPPHPGSPKLHRARSFSELIIKLRHALCFRSSEFSTHTGRIERDSRDYSLEHSSQKKNMMENRSWEADLSEKELRGLAYTVVGYVEKEYG